MANVAYVRVSTVEQNEQRQIEALEKHSIDKWFVEKVSAKDIKRPQFQALLDYVREGDTIYIHDFSRLARSTQDLLNIVEQLADKGVKLVSNKENLDSSTPTGKLMLTMIGAINQFERDNLLERQREGIAIAVREGKYKGRKEVNIPNFEKHYQRYMTREISKAALARELSISRPTLDKLIKEHEEDNKYFNPYNMKILKESIAQAERGETVTKSLAELEAMESEDDGLREKNMIFRR